jgi:diguanylate cyclase (GGDEF)-like protein
MLHTPESLEKGNPADAAHRLGCILSLAALCEDLVTSPGKANVLAELHQRAKKLLGLDVTRVNDLLAQLESRTAEMAEILNVKIGDRLQVSEILREAQEEVLQETLAMLQSAVMSERRATQLEEEKSLLLLKTQTDSLTGLANRSMFEEYLASCFEWGQDRLPVGLLMIDIDDFKQVNDVYGHPVGDEVLRSVAAIIRDITRHSDIAARYGGEEFAIIMPRTPPVALKNVAERVRTQIESQRFVTGQGDIPVTVSIGGAHSDLIQAPAVADDLLKVADRYLYDAKRAGRNRCIFAPGGVSAGDNITTPSAQATRSK